MKHHKKRISQVPLQEPSFGKTKKIKVWENGEMECHIFNLNPKDFRRWYVILSHITEMMHPHFGAVKKLIELSSGTEVTSFEELNPKQKYIAMGMNDKLKELSKGYKTPTELIREEKEANKRSPMYAESGRVSHNWEFLKQTEKLRNTVVYVTLNGSHLPPHKVVFKDSEIEDANLIGRYCSNILGIPDGILRFSTIYGRILQDPRDFQHGYLYVAIPLGETYVQMDYMEFFNKNYKQRKPKHVKIPSHVIRSYSSSLSQRIRKNRKSRKLKTVKVKKHRKSIIPPAEKKKLAVHLKSNKVTHTDLSDSETELNVTYYSNSEEDQRPSYRPRICTRVNSNHKRNNIRLPTNILINKRIKSNIMRPSFPMNKITLTDEILLQNNEERCDGDSHDLSNDEETNYEEINYEQVQYEKLNTEVLCQKFYTPPEVVQEREQLVYGMWCNQIIEQYNNQTDDNYEQTSNCEMMQSEAAGPSVYAIESNLSAESYTQEPQRNQTKAEQEHEEQVNYEGTKSEENSNDQNPCKPSYCAYCDLLSISSQEHDCKIDYTHAEGDIKVREIKNYEQENCDQNTEIGQKQNEKPDKQLIPNQRNYETEICEQAKYELDNNCERENYEQGNCKQVNYETESEREHCEQENFEQKNCEQEDCEQENCEPEHSEQDNVEQENFEQDNCEQKNSEQEDCEQENCEQENFEQENFEQENFEQENFEQENFEQENFEQENFEQENFEQENFGQDNCEQKHSEQEHSEQEHSEQEHSEQEHSEQEHSEQEHSEQEHSEQEHSKQEHSKQEHSKQEHSEQEHSEQEHSEQEHSEQEHSEQEHREQEHSEQEHSEQEHREQENCEQGSNSLEFFDSLEDIHYVESDETLCNQKKNSEHSNYEGDMTSFREFTYTTGNSQTSDIVIDPEKEQNCALNKNYPQPTYRMKDIHYVESDETRCKEKKNGQPTNYEVDMTSYRKLTYTRGNSQTNDTVIHPEKERNCELNKKYPQPTYRREHTHSAMSGEKNKTKYNASKISQQHRSGVDSKYTVVTMKSSSSQREPIRTLSQQIWEANSSAAVSYHCHPKKSSYMATPASEPKRTVPRIVSWKVHSEPKRNICSSNKTIEGISKMSQNTLNEHIINATKTIKIYEEKLAEIDEYIQSDPVVQKLMKKTPHHY